MCRLTSSSEQCNHGGDCCNYLDKRSIDHFIDTNRSDDNIMNSIGDSVRSFGQKSAQPEKNLTSEISNLIRWNKENTKKNHLIHHQESEAKFPLDPSIVIPIIEPFPSKKFITPVNDSKFGQLNKSFLEKIENDICKQKKPVGVTLEEVSQKIDQTISTQQFMINLFAQQNQKLMVYIDNLKNQVSSLT